MNRFKKILKSKITWSIIFFLCVFGILGILFPSQMIDTFRYLPYSHNPLAWTKNESIPELNKQLNSADFVTQLKTKSMLVKFNLTMNEREKREVIAYLPKGYDPNDTTKHYPVIYLLHGSPGQDMDWIIEGNAQKTFDDEINNGKIAPCIAIFPDGNGGSNNDTQFINSADGKELNEDFIAKIVVNFVDANFNTIPDPLHRAIGGASSGGFGALNIGLKHQDIFGYILSFSGYWAIQKAPETQIYIQHSQKVVDENSPSLYIPHLTDKSVKVFLLSSNAGSPHVDTQRINDLLQNNGFDVHFISYNGSHSWGFWSKHLFRGLEWLNNLWK
jgi:enterochelin esterase-like enzyme